MAPLFFSKLRAQSIESDEVNGYQVFRIKEDLALGADFGSLTALLDRALKKGRGKVAIHFTPRSYLYTPTIARLVEYYKLLSDKGGTLCLVQPNEEILQVLETIGLTKLIRIVSSEEEI
jgi:anti-anti-sigma factor